MIKFVLIKDDNDSAWVSINGKMPKRYKVYERNGIRGIKYQDKFMPFDLMEKE